MKRHISSGGSVMELPKFWDCKYQSRLVGVDHKQLVLLGECGHGIMSRL